MEVGRVDPVQSELQEQLAEQGRLERVFVRVEQLLQLVVGLVLLLAAAAQVLGRAGFVPAAPLELVDLDSSAVLADPLVPVYLPLVTL